VAKKVSENHLVVAFESTDAPGLYGRKFLVRGLSFLGNPLCEKIHLLAKPRYRDSSQRICYHPLKQQGLAEITFDKPQRALAPGQMIAFYDGERLLGGGFYR